MKKIGILVCFALLISAPVFANVMAFDISVDTSSGVPEISYRLNESASSVLIEVFGPLPSTTVIGTVPGTTAKGLNTVKWSGSGSIAGQIYGFKVTASDSVGYGDWTLLNDNAELKWDFEQGRKVIVNNNQASPYFGMIYISCPRDGTTASGRDTFDGIYAMYPDGSDPLGIGETPKTGGVDWSTSDWSSPYTLFVGEDDKLWIADWSDTHSGVWRAEPDLSGSFTEILSPTQPDAIDASGLNSIHGSISGCYVEGTGSSTVLYVQDEDLPDASTDPGRRNYYKYEIGDGPFPWTTAGSIFLDETNFSSHPQYDVEIGLFVNDTAGTIRKDASGNWFVHNYRSPQDFPNIMKFSNDGSTLIWDDVVNGAGGDTGKIVLNGNQGGFDIDFNNNRIVVSAMANGFRVFPLDPLPDGDIDTAATLVPGSDPAVDSGRGICVDAAGNVYCISNLSERLAIVSPPGPNSFSTEASETLTGGSYILSAHNWSLYE